MDDIKILEAVEQYINGQLSPDERVYFEQLRKTNPEIDQLVVEHTFFLQQMNRFDETRKLKHKLNDIHTGLAEKGAIQSPNLQGRTKVIYLFNRYKRTAAIAASIAGITALAISILVSSLSPSKPVQEYTQLKRDINQKINQLQQKNRELDQKINRVDNNQKASVSPPITYTSGGTGFLIDPKGYLVTNAHVVQNANNIAVQNSNGKDFNVDVVFIDLKSDLAILKIKDSAFKTLARLPYTIRRSSTDIAEPIYTLGYPRNNIVYGEGYLAAKTGFNDDTLSCQIAIAANPGNSGGPVLNRNGEVIGILNAKQVNAEGAVFAIQSRYIYQLLNELDKDTAYQNIKIPAVSALKGVDRMQQVKKISDYVFMVKVN